MRVIVAFLLAAKASAFGPNGPCFVKEVWKESDVQEFDSIVFGSVRKLADLLVPYLELRWQSYSFALQAWMLGPYGLKCHCCNRTTCSSIALSTPDEVKYDSASQQHTPTPTHLYCIVLFECGSVL